jgi:nitrate reductase NapD
MNVCGVLVHAVPSRVAAVVDALVALDGVDVHQTADGGRIVVTVEDTENSPAIDTLRDIHRLDGIVAASLIYHHFDPDLDTNNHA